MLKKPVTTQQPKSTRHKASEASSDLIRSQAAEQPGVASAETSSSPADIARAKLAELSVSEADVAAAIRWARSTERASG